MRRMSGCLIRKKKGELREEKRKLREERRQRELEKEQKKEQLRIERDAFIKKVREVYVRYVGLPNRVAYTGLSSSRRKAKKAIQDFLNTLMSSMFKEDLSLRGDKNEH